MILNKYIFPVFVLIWKLWVIIISIFFTILFGPIIFICSFKVSHFKIAYFFIFLWSKCIFHLSGFWYKLENPNHIKLDKNQQYIFISNHTSMMDICLMVILNPKHLICFVGKKELENVFFFGKIYKRVAVMVDRNSEQSRMSVYRRCAAKMQEGKSIVIFPEGGVSEIDSVDLLNFRDGAFVLATEHQFPIVVYTFVDLKEKFPFSFTKGCPGKINVVLNNLLEPIENKQDLKEKSYNLIKKTLEIKK